MSQKSYIVDLADVEARESLPLQERELPNSTFEMIRQGTALVPEAPALSFFLDGSEYREPFTFTNREVMQSVTRAANAFRRLGLGRDDVIAFLLPNLPETLFTIWGGEAAGVVLALNPLLEKEALAELMRAGKAKFLVTLGPTPGSDLWEKAVWAASKVGTLEGVIQVSVAPYVRGLKGRALKAHDKLQSLRSFGLYVPILTWEKALAGAVSDSLDFAPPESDDVSSYFCTGGTTGLPKLAVRTHGNEVFNAWAIQEVVRGAYVPHNAIFCGLPLFHVNGQMVTGLAPWAAGAHVILGTPQGYRGPGVIDNFWAIAEHYKIMGFSGVPTVYAALVERAIQGRDLTSLEFALCGAAPMPVGLFQRFESEIDLRILEGYGLTEGACVSSVNPAAGERRTGSIGLRIPYQKMMAAVLNDKGEFERKAATDEAGVILISGPNVFRGYLNEAHNEGVWLQIEGERWFNTGDLGRQDEAGYFWLTGRKKELIIRGGHNIDPTLIEEVMALHPAVALAAAVGRPHPRLGEVPADYVELKESGEADEIELLRYAVENVGEKSARPDVVRIVEALPVTPVGKIFKPELLRREIEDVVREVAQRVNVELIALNVVADPNLGNVAQATVRGDFESFQQALAEYTFPVRLES